MTVQPNAVFIGTTSNGEHIKNLNTKWNWLPTQETLGELATNINTGDITNEIEIIITDTSRVQDPTVNTEFVSLLSRLAPYCFFTILGNDTPDFHTKISNIRTYLSNPELGAEAAKFWVINRSNISPEFKAAKQEFIKNPTPKNREAAAIIAGDVIERHNTQTSGDTTPMRLKEYNPEQTYLSGGTYAGRVITFTSTKGGVGKSTTALSVATGLIQQSRAAVKAGRETRELKVCVVDLDRADGQVGFYLKQYDPTITGLYRESMSNRDDDGYNILTEDMLKRHMSHSDTLGFDTLLAPKKASDAEHIDEEFYRDVIQALRRYYDVIILDTSVPVPGDYNDGFLKTIVYPASYRLYYVVEPVSAAVLSMTRWVNEILDSKGTLLTRPDATRVIINKMVPKNGNNIVSLEFIDKSSPGAEIVSVLPFKLQSAWSTANTGMFTDLVNSPGFKDGVEWILDDFTQDERFDYDLFSDKDLLRIRSN